MIDIIQSFDASIFAVIIRHYYENNLDTEEPTTEFHPISYKSIDFPYI